MSTERQRFNMGFFDGAWARGRSSHLGGHQLALDDRHFDRIYAEGYRAGWYLEGDTPESSDTAWKLRQDARKASAAERKATRGDRAPMFASRY